MSSGQADHFRAILTNWRLELMEQVDGTVTNLQEKAGSLPDPNDRASQESEFGLELKTRDRERKLIRKIDEGSKSAGSYSVVWDGRSDDGDRVSSGVYFYQIQTKDFNKTMKMLFVK